MQARIFDIQRGSFVDGPGIRTTVFFQGCNLRCVWCHNPESWERKNVLMVYESRCTHCGVCAIGCPAGAIDRTGHTDRTKCVLCGACVELCPNEARSMCGREIDTADLLRTVLKDRNFYEDSGGGVTFSGGECMLQIDALQEALEALHRDGVDTAVDTAGNVPWAFFERILDTTDHFLYDIKCLSPSLHRKLTGADNALILDNCRRLMEICPEKTIVRVPVIPNANDTGDEMERVGAFLAGFHPALVEYLPYHRLGEGKWNAMGKPAFTARIPDKGRIEQLNRLTSGS